MLYKTSLPFLTVLGPMLNDTFCCKYLSNNLRDLWILSDIEKGRFFLHRHGVYRIVKIFPEVSPIARYWHLTDQNAIISAN